MKNADMIKAQESFIIARGYLAAAEAGYKAELVSSGIQDKLDAWLTGDLDPEVMVTHDNIFAKWGVKDASAEMDRAELALVNCLLDSIEKRSPSKRDMVATLRKHIAATTRYCPKRVELVKLALTWCW
jgi:hypothetical protein